MSRKWAAREPAGFAGGYVGPLVAAGVSFFAGVLLGAGMLVLQPVPRLKAEPKGAGATSGAVFFIEGRRDPAHRRIAAEKIELLLRGQGVDFSEEDLNALLDSALGALNKARPNAPAKLEAPNVRIRAGVIQVAGEVSVEVLGFRPCVLLQARGRVVQEAGQWSFAPVQISVGALPLDRIPGAVDWIRQRWLDPRQLRPEWAAAWAQLGRVRVEGDVVRVSLR